MPFVFISTLARCAAPGSTAHMGALARASVPVDGEALLRNLVSDPTATVGALLDDDTWPITEARIVAELAAAPDKATRDAVKLQIPALVPARFKSSTRSKAECLGRQIVGHDFDHVVAETFEAACELIRASLPGRFLVIHTTATERNADGTWRLRAYEILDLEATSEEWNACAKPHMQSLGEHDPQALDVARLLYLPVRTAGYRFAVFEGPRTQLDDLRAVAAAPAERPVAATAAAPQAPQADARRKAMALLGAAWPPVGARHDAKLALSGALAREGWPEAETLEFMRAMPTEDPSKLAPDVRSSYQKMAAGASFTGWPKLGEIIGAGTASDVRDLLNGTAAMRQRGAEVEAARAAKPSEGIGLEYGAWDAEPLPIEFLVDGLLPRGCVGMFFGRADALKTWLLFSLGIAVASGKPWLGRFNVSEAKVGIIDYETGKGNAHRRLYMLRAGRNPNLGSKSFAKLKPNKREFWEALKPENLELVIVDSLRKANPGANEDKSGEAIVPLELAADFSEDTGCAVLFVHHAKKDSADGWPDFRGSGAIEDQVDVSFAVRKTDVSVSPPVPEGPSFDGIAGALVPSVVFLTASAATVRLKARAP